VNEKSAKITWKLGKKTNDEGVRKRLEVFVLLFSVEKRENKRNVDNQISEPRRERGREANSSRTRCRQWIQSKAKVGAKVSTNHLRYRNGKNDELFLWFDGQQQRKHLLQLLEHLLLFHGAHLLHLITEQQKDTEKRDR
jgi:hypothetical protein